MALHRDIYWIGRQWAVTGFGVQAVNQKHAGEFDISVENLWDDDPRIVLRGQKWFNPEDFAKGLAIAQARYPRPLNKPAPAPLPVERLLQASTPVAPPPPAPPPAAMPVATATIDLTTAVPAKPPAAAPIKSPPALPAVERLVQANPSPPPVAAPVAAPIIAPPTLAVTPAAPESEPARPLLLIEKLLRTNPAPPSVAPVAPPIEVPAAVKVTAVEPVIISPAAQASAETLFQTSAAQPPPSAMPIVAPPDMPAVVDVPPALVEAAQEPSRPQRSMASFTDMRVPGQAKLSQVWRARRGR